jgi:hypothetical protein
VNRFAHKHALADVIVEETQNQADTAEPALTGRGEVLRFVLQGCIPEPTVHACADETKKKIVISGLQRLTLNIPSFGILTDWSALL